MIGAGAAGLAAAWTLAVRGNNRNCRVLVLEASDKIGGRMFCEEIDGFHVYGGASVIHKSFTTTRELASELDVELHQSPKSKGAQSYADGRFLGVIGRRFPEADFDKPSHDAVFASAHACRNPGNDALVLNTQEVQRKTRFRKP